MANRTCKHRKRRWAAPFLIITLLAPLWLRGDEEPPAPSSPAPAVSFRWFIPGWEQLRRGQIVKGGLLLSAFAGAAVGAVVFNHRGNNRYDQYRASTDVMEVVRLRREAEDAFRTRNVFLIGLASVWLIHALDLTFSGGGVRAQVIGDRFQTGVYILF